MQLMEFFEKVEAHPDLVGEGIDKPEAKTPGAIVRHVKTGLSTRLPIEAIEKADWAVIEEVLTCRREPVALQHMTRVVGYYSRIDNWNKSKLGELNDRHHGNYALPEQQAAATNC